MDVPRAFTQEETLQLPGEHGGSPGTTCSWGGVGVEEVFSSSFPPLYSRNSHRGAH